MSRLDAFDALDIFTRCQIYWAQDFHRLNSDDVAKLIREADAHGYRAPRNANGSRARYFHAYLVRVIQSADKAAKR